jgi:hypothetical protein
MKLATTILTSALLLAYNSTAQAACADPAALAALRGLVQQQCDCANAASPRSYKACATAVAAAAVADGRLPSSCRGDAARCAAKSTCGRPGAVTCCRRTASGAKSCSVKPSAGQCVAPPGGSACAGVFASCCDACDAAGACNVPIPTPTPVVPRCGNGVREGSEQCDGSDFSGATCADGSAGTFLRCRADCTIDESSCPAPLPDTSCHDPILRLPPIVKLPIDTVTGSSSCGGPGLVPDATSPFAGQLLDGSQHKLADLGTDCLYVGGGASTLAPFPVATGSTTVLAVVGLRGLTAIAGPSAGSGPSSCTFGAGPGKHCLNGKTGTDGAGACATDVDCGNVAGACGLDANCFFGAPLSIASPVAACALNVVRSDFCAEANLLAFSLDVHGALSTRVYLGACPRCSAGKCAGGARDGDSCSADVNGTSVDCPPAPSGFLGQFSSVQHLSTDTLESSDPGGAFCAGQHAAGAFGVAGARTVRTTGQRLNLLSLQATLAGPFCALPSGNPLVDGLVGLPAPGAASLKGKVDLVKLLHLLGP